MIDLVTLGAIIGNVGSVVGVVITNKYIVAIDNFNFVIFLSFLHFVSTYLGMLALMHLKFFSYKGASLRGVLPVAMVSSSSNSSNSSSRRRRMTTKMRCTDFGFIRAMS